MTRFTRFILWIVIFSVAPHVSPKSLAESEFITEHQFSDFKISFRLPSLEAARSFLTPARIEQAEEVVTTLMAFESEMLDTQDLWGADFDFLFHNTGRPAGYADLTVRANFQDLFKDFRIDETRFISDKIGYMRFRIFDRGIPSDYRYEIYNLDFDMKGRILKRVILKSVLDRRLPASRPFIRLEEGRWIEYSGYTQGPFPQTYLHKTFILDKDGSKRWLKEVYGYDRVLTATGFVTHEKLNITLYRYSGLDSAKTYGIYNLVLHPKGELNSCDFIFLKSPDVRFSADQHYEITYLRNDEGRPLRKLIRKYEMAGGVKMYTEGSLQEFTLDEASRLKVSRESTFKIRPNARGLLPEDRILKEVRYVWNLAIDEKGHILRKRTVKTQFVELNVGGTSRQLELLQSVKEVASVRDPQADILKEIRLTYFDFSSQGRFGPSKDVWIRILEYTPDADPVRAELTVEYASPPFKDKQEITQDCSFMINEAFSGTLFDQKSKRSFDVAVMQISPERLQVARLDRAQVNGKRQYILREPQTVEWGQ